MTSSDARFSPHLQRDIEDVLNALHRERASAHLAHSRLLSTDEGPENDLIHRRDDAQQRIRDSHAALRSFRHLLASVTPSAAAPGSAPPPRSAGSGSSLPRSTGSGC